MFRRATLPVAVVASAWILTPRSSPAVDPGSVLVGCEHADERVTLDTTAHLDPSCTWTKGVRIVASDVTLDCQGARIASDTGRLGLHIVAPTDVALSRVRVRNCHVEGFLNGMHVEREGFRDLAAGVEYENSFSDIVIEDSTVSNTRGVGVYVNGYVTGVTLRRLHVEGAGSTGIYLETGSKDNVVEDNEVVNNGYRENGPSGQFFEFAGLTFWFWGTGREGLAIDGSRTNVVRRNYFAGNAAGGIFLYKNCGEYPDRDRYFERRYGAHGNVIEDNDFVGGRSGVWIASRMAENVIPMECTDPQYTPGYALDHAADNVVRANRFQDVTYGIRVEDDRATVEDNVFESSDPAHVAVLLGTPIRTSALGLPVRGTRVAGNHARIAGSKNPYRWVHGHASTTFADNRSEGRVVGLCEGVAPARGPFVMTVAFVPADPGDPPAVEPPVLPPPEPLPPCPMACEGGSATTGVRLAVRHLSTPPGDDVLRLKGRLVLAHPFDPALDPMETGVGVVVQTAAGERVLDEWIPGGAYDPEARVGWKSLPDRPGWRYLDRRPAPGGGIRSVLVRDLSSREPGAVAFRVSARRGAYPVTVADLPLTAILSLDPPTAETGQCGTVSFDGVAGSCRHAGTQVICH